MTHANGTIRRTLELAQEGRSVSEVARLLGLPRRTVQDWIHGRLPARFGPAPSGRCTACGHLQHDFAALPPAYVLLLGLYLGDGCLSPHPRNVFKLRISLDARYPEIASASKEAIEAVLPEARVNRVDNGTWWEVYAYSKSWPCLFPQHGPGRKHERRIVLLPWQWQLVYERPDLLLRGLLHSDGHRFQSTGRGGWSHPRYAFTNASQDIRSIFTATCELIGLRWTASGERTIYVSRKADVAVLDLLVGPKR